MHFLLWANASHQSPKCSGENLSNSLRHFPNHKWFYLQILLHSSVSWKITTLYFLGQTLHTLHERGQSRMFVDIWALGSKFTKFLSFLKHEICFFLNWASLFSVMRHNSSVLFSWNFIYFQWKEPIKVQIWNFTWAIDVWNFPLWWAPFVQII